LKRAAIGLLALVGALLVVATWSLPPLRDPHGPISRHVEPYYVSRALEETGTPNLVTAILADYRGYDTFGETTVIFAAGLACYLLLRRTDR
jgi:multicomponent Na+:H+ antiporter subunit B